MDSNGYLEMKREIAEWSLVNRVPIRLDGGWYLVDEIQRIPDREDVVRAHVYAQPSLPEPA